MHASRPAARSSVFVPRTAPTRKSSRRQISRRSSPPSLTLKDFVDQRLEKNGVTIEGIAIKDDKTLYAGFRGPVLKGDEGKSRAVVLSAPLDALFDGGAAQHKLFRLPLGPGRGVRDLASFEGGILILAGPAASEAGTYAIYSWDGGRRKRKARWPNSRNSIPSGSRRIAATGQERHETARPHHLRQRREGLRQLRSRVPAPSIRRATEPVRSPAPSSPRSRAGSPTSRRRSCRRGR